MSERPEFSLTIGYASDMGTAEYIAMQLADACKAAGVDVTETELNDIALDDVAAASHFIVVASTFGEGEVPDNGTVFWEELSASEARFDHLRYAVLALGDSSYELFCNAGRIFDARLAEMGARPLADRVEFDCYREGDAREWIADIAKMIEEASTATPGHTTAAPVAPRPTPTRSTTPWTDANPYAATAVVNRLLTATESDKEVRHIELDLGDSGITYDAGDSVAVHPVNAPELVEALLAKLGVDDTYIAAGADLPLSELLTSHLEICAPSRALQALVAARTDNAEAAAALTFRRPGSGVVVVVWPRRTRPARARRADTRRGAGSVAALAVSRLFDRLQSTCPPRSAAPDGRDGALPLPRARPRRCRLDLPGGSRPIGANPPAPQPQLPAARP